LDKPGTGGSVGVDGGLGLGSVAVLALSPRQLLGLRRMSSTMEGLNDLEHAVLDMLLSGSGDDPVLAVLREQASAARLARRERTGVGFFCSFEVPSEAPTIVEHPNFEISDVEAELEGLKHGAGFVLFVRDGRLDMLEGFSYDEPWPTEIGNFRLAYSSEPRVRVPSL